MPSVSILATLLATVLGFALGAVWYGPLFSKAWMAENKLTEEQIKKDFNPARTYGLTFLLGLISAYTFGAFVGADPDLVTSTAMGALVGTCWIAAAVASHYLFEGKTLRHFLINAGYDVVRFTLIGLAFGLLG